MNQQQVLPSISVVIPCYNVEAFVESTIQSVIDQTYQPIEIICIDDGSTDNTLAMLRHMQIRNGNILIRVQSNQGASAARNAGLAISKGEYIQFLDSDDLLHPHKLAHQAKLIAKSKNWPDFIAAACKSVNVEDKTDRITHTQIHHDRWVGLIDGRGIGITSANLWRALSIQNISGWDSSSEPCDDSDLIFRLLKEGSNVLTDTNEMTTLRRRQDSLFNSNKINSYRAMMILRCKIYDYLREQNMYTPDRKRMMENRIFSKIPYFIIRNRSLLWKSSIV